MKVMICFAILVLCCSMCFSQGISIGANLGGNYNTLDPDMPDSETMTGIGFGGGVVFELDLMPMISTELDVQYAMYKYNYSTEGFEIKMDANNLVVPLLIKYKMSMPTVSPYFAIGPSLIKNLSATITTVDDGEEETYDVDSEDLETDFGLQVGAGANIGMMPGLGISPYARFQYNLTADMDDTQTANESMYDILFGVNLMYKIK